MNEILIIMNKVLTVTTSEHMLVWVFGIPLIIVCIVNWLKHSVGVKHDDRVLGELLLDDSIDAVTIGLTIVLTYFHLKGESEGLASTLKVLGVLVIMVEIRRRYINGNIKNSIFRFLSVIFCLLLAFGLILNLYKTIS